jgi:hypothetical protein
MAEGAAGFWSYAHADDQGDHGRVGSLREHLETQFRLATGGDALDLFFDRSDIRWGEAWEKKIDGAIAGTTFFIAIITPSYFRSEECRRELLAFAREADKLGLQKLLMAVYWRTVPELHNNPAESQDAAIRLIERYQWKDLRDARLADEHSAVFRTAVDELAEALVARAAEAEHVEDAPQEVNPAEGVRLHVHGGGAATVVADAVPAAEALDGELGTLDRLATGEEAMEAIVELVEAIGAQLETVGQVAQKSNDEFQATLAKGQGSAKAGLVLTEKFARTLSEPAKELERLGDEYSQRLADLDSAVTAQLDIRETEDGPMSAEAREELESFVVLARTMEETSTQLDELVTSTEPLVKASRSLRAPIRQLRSGLRSISDGKPTIQRWADRAGERLNEKT